MSDKVIKDNNSGAEMMTKQEAIYRAKELRKNINTLLKSISNLLEDEKEITMFFDFGFIGCLSSAGCVDTIFQCGKQSGLELSHNYLKNKFIVGSEEEKHESI